MKETISIRLFNTLQKGKGQLGREALQRIVCFLESQRTAEDSFIGKSGKADLYYTLFGWMLSYVLGIRLDPQKTALYLAQQDVNSLDLIHYAAYIRCRMINNLTNKGKVGLLFSSLFSKAVRELESFHSLPHNDPQSPYTWFVWLSILEDTGNKISGKDEIPEALSAYHLPEGGYMNTQDGLTATTNATAAALAVIGQLVGYKENTDINYVRDLQEESGGFKAAEASPVPDLLSTATSLLILSNYGVKPKYPAKDFIEAHWLDSGGFSATLLDDKSDVEYTFYGLLALGSM
ncbi:hypothetical protein M2459_000073 [Parabacteroides sp. PF5-5]|uniref:prenyltransferase/squalene oxidase repeat-containing protein n=1 Tax=unclassified Parabacteroides TaxID=2649774 RepID=UPI002472EF03|nr:MULTISPECIES: prenyltransferase/squalene oxidase repeat-containing protein [unclassified Parabacteroides]MDH6303741.1 hypothetical protein [Parabacteroides sp. PH5-39]MDH6314358.1 hypothetical protein [Parabacteroides sp. PF5-13]MDH6318577.1 hypothetical protein [Parabacteroides sp. PH5-13]MDH6322130.1 hypothetical protein [Parabacteroides sp. PH5-8]MDH6325790.1 hypothetical protein [Parabacteroides sp. PH5-41]